VCRAVAVARPGECVADRSPRAGHPAQPHAHAHRSGVAADGGQGNLGFGADITGLQTFQDQYSPRMPLMIQTQWAWHSFPNPTGFSLAQAEQPVDVRGQSG